MVALKTAGLRGPCIRKSWRLGGKAASVRAGDGRILSNGLHVWLGCYENAFRMMRECYAEVEDYQWGPRPPAETLAYGRIDDAFFPEPHIGFGAAPILIAIGPYGPPICRRRRDSPANLSTSIRTPSR